MAKLSARGRTCIAQAVKEYDSALLQTLHDRSILRRDPAYQAGSDKALTTWERTTLRLMSDRTILEKRDVIFQPDWLDKHGRRHSYAWKVYGKLKTGLNAADFVRIYSAPRKDGSASRWTVTTSGLQAPKVISQSRIMRAVQSGDSIGFCTDCGAEQSGVEPDADGYKCESCGAMAVSGAENLLLGIA